METLLNDSRVLASYSSYQSRLNLFMVELATELVQVFLPIFKLLTA